MQIHQIVGLTSAGLLTLLVAAYAYFPEWFHNNEWREKKRVKQERKHELIKNHFNIEEKDYVLREDRGVTNQYTLYVEGKQYHVQFQESNEDTCFKKLVHVPLNTKFK
jgi:hypothetical protein